MEGFRVDPNSRVPPSEQIVGLILDGLATGGFAPGAKLPSVRVLAVEVLVNPNTVGKAYAELERLGVVVGRNGSGVYVTAGGPARAIELRQAATLAEFSDSARSALRVGHSAEVLVSLVQELEAGTVGGVER